MRTKKSNNLLEDSEIIFKKSQRFEICIHSQKHPSYTENSNENDPRFYCYATIILNYAKRVYRILCCSRKVKKNTYIQNAKSQNLCNIEPHFHFRLDRNQNRKMEHTPVTFEYLIRTGFWHQKVSMQRIMQGIVLCD